MKSPDSRNHASLFSLRSVLVTISLLGALSLAGCAGSYGVFSAGDGYYAPDYSGYYGEYGYDGGPYYGYDPGYYGSFVIGNARYNRSYGHHHFTGNFHGDRSRARGQNRERGDAARSRPSAPQRSGNSSHNGSQRDHP